MEIIKRNETRNNYVDILRFVFCFLIINYHLFSHFLIDIDFPNYFTRSYLGDEFFFIISGFYLSRAAQQSEGNPFSWGIKQSVKRIKKIAIPYYITWFLCFWGVRLTQAYNGGVNRSIIEDAANSIYELLFLEMFGFKSGLYSNDVAWFFSALLIVTFILSPWVAKYKRRFSMYFAPLIVFFSYGILSLNYDWLYAPYYLIGNSYIMKGLVRALAAVCIGVVLDGILASDGYSSQIKVLQDRWKRIICIIDVIVWLIIFAYMVYPFKSRSYDTQVQYDYIIVLLMGIALIPVLGDIWPGNHSARISAFAGKLGKYAFFAYFGQAIFYSIDKIIYSLDVQISIKAFILHISVFLLSAILYFLNQCLVRIFNKIDKKE